MAEEAETGSVAAASKLKLRSGEMMLVAEPAEEIVALIRAGEPLVTVLRADGHRNVLHVSAAAIEYVEDITPGP